LCPSNSRKALDPAADRRSLDDAAGAGCVPRDDALGRLPSRLLMLRVSESAGVGRLPPVDWLVKGVSAGGNGGGEGEMGGREEAMSPGW